MPTITTLNSYSFAFNGFVFGGADSPYQITSVDGIEDLPTLRVQDDNRGYQDGMFTGRDFLSGRSILMTLQVFGTSNANMNQNLNLLQSALIPQSSGVGLLQFQIPYNNLQRVYARVRRRAVRIDPDFTYGRAIVTYEFFAPDPRRYDDTLQNTDLIGGAATTGRTYNRVYTTTASPGSYPNTAGMSFGGGSSANNLIANNGNTTTYPSITITGPATNPIVTNTTAGAFLQINYTMATTDQLVINTDLRTLTLNGVSRRSILANNSTWFGAQPGNSLYTFNAGSTGGTTTCLVSWRSAYI